MIPPASTLLTAPPPVAFAPATGAAASLPFEAVLAGAAPALAEDVAAPAPPTRGEDVVAPAPPNRAEDVIAPAPQTRVEDAALTAGATRGELAAPLAPHRDGGSSGRTRLHHAHAFRALGLFGADATPAVGAAGSADAPGVAAAAVGPSAGESSTRREPTAAEARLPKSGDMLAGGPSVPHRAQGAPVARQAALAAPPPARTGSPLAAAPSSSIQSEVSGPPRVRRAVGRPTASEPNPARAAAALRLAERDGKLMVVAAAAHFNPAEFLRLRGLMAQAAAASGAVLGELTVNGMGAGPVSSTEGATHGHRPR